MIAKHRPDLELYWLLHAVANNHILSVRQHPESLGTYRQTMDGGLGPVSPTWQRRLREMEQQGWVERGPKLTTPVRLTPKGKERWATWQ
jgi:DNA-binding HxlR family transcriptional regulator